MPTLAHYLVLSAILFAIGTAGVFVRRNLITILLSIEIMLNAVNLTFVAFGRAQGAADGQVIVFFVITVAADLYLGGWHGPFLPESLGWIWFLIKVAAILFFYVWMRWTLPRYRYDQLMSFGWKMLLPLSVINLLVTAAGVLYFGL